MAYSRAVSATFHQTLMEINWICGMCKGGHEPVGRTPPEEMSSSGDVNPTFWQGG